MKKVIIAGLMILTPLAVHANSAGCGLGAQLFDGQSGLGPNILAATTNGISGNNTFGMSSGTLGCDANDTVTAAADTFLDANMERVARDMATGEGESLDTLATLMGVEAADKAAFYTASQSNFKTIFSSDDVSSSEVMASLKAVMSKDADLAKYAA